MKRKIDKSAKPKDVPPVSKQQFIEEYVKAAQAEYGFDEHYQFTSENAAGLIRDVIKGSQGPSEMLKALAKQHGAKQGRVGNFLRGLR